MTRETFTQAANRQYLHASIYTVYLCGPNGERVYLGETQRKTGSGLLGVVTSKKAQAILAGLPNAESFRLMKKTASALILNDGWQVRFGGTIRDEAAQN